MRISFIGAGNLATRLGIALKAAGHDFVQVYSRTEASAVRLASLLEAEPVTRPEQMLPDTPLVLCALRDDALAEVLAQVPHGDGILAHTAGSLPLEVLKPFSDRMGVFYPLQTFSKDKEVDFSRIPVFVEAEDAAVRQVLTELAESLGSAVEEVTSSQRLQMHLAAVFACNFVNHLYTISSDLLAEQGLSFDLLKPLILETADKVQHLAPERAQTGPAVRFDRGVMDKHEAQLGAHPDWKALYEELSQAIHQRTSTNRL